MRQNAAKQCRKKNIQRRIQSYGKICGEDLLNQDLMRKQF